MKKHSGRVEQEQLSDEERSLARGERKNQPSFGRDGCLVVSFRRQAGQTEEMPTSSSAGSWTQIKMQNDNEGKS